MRKHCLEGVVTIFVLLILAVAPSFALENEFTVGPEVSHITYNEPGVTEKGWFYGLAGSDTLKVDVGRNTKITVGPELKIAKGTVKYEGSTWGGNPASASGIHDTLFEARGLIGLEYNFNKNTALRPYTGFGYRSLVDEFSEAGSGGYDRWIRYYYVPVGVAFSTNFSDGWKFKTTAEYDWFIRGKVTGYFNNSIETVNVYGIPYVVATLGNVENTQKSGYGLRGSIELSKNFGSFSVAVKPYVKYWNIEKSNEATAGYYLTPDLYYAPLNVYEPKNHSTEVGLGFIISF